MPTFLAFHHISWESPISSDLVTKCLPDLLSGKNSCYSWHTQMPVQILGTPLWGVHFIPLQQEIISLIQGKTMDHGIVKYNWRHWWEWDGLSFSMPSWSGKFSFKRKMSLFMSPGIHSLQLKMLLEIKGVISVKLCLYSIILATSLSPQGLEVLRAKYENLYLEYLILYMENQWDFQSY